MVHVAHGILISGMKTLIQLLLLSGLVACASPYYPVFVSSDGDYYIAERSASGPYYGSNTVMYSDIGVYPWWTNGYPLETFVYYSPYFYPHYFSIWYPPGFHPYFGYYGGYYAYWCPPHRLRRHHAYINDDKVSGSPVLPPVVYSGQPVANPELWQSIDRRSVSRERMHRGGIGHRATLYSRTAPDYSGSSTAPGVSSSFTGSTRSSGAGRSISRSASSSRRSSISNGSPTLHDQ